MWLVSTATIGCKMLYMACGACGEWLDSQFVKWQNDQGGRRTLDDFADHRGFKCVTLSKWINGQRKPEKASVEQLAAKLGLEAYDKLRLQRPDPPVAKIVGLQDRRAG